MGGSYERVENERKNTMRRQRAELLLRLEVLMSVDERNDTENFPKWIYWYRSKERNGNRLQPACTQSDITAGDQRMYVFVARVDEDGTSENGIINGVARRIMGERRHLEERLVDLKAGLKADYQADLKVVQDQLEQAQQQAEHAQQQIREMGDKLDTNVANTTEILRLVQEMSPASSTEQAPEQEQVQRE
jgi:hypothetical protein